jgi:GNAT superfamily N-acetyltransferase
MSAILPIPRSPITIRVATMDDLPFIDGLQKKHHKQLGFFPRAQLEGYLSNGWVLIAEEAAGPPLGYIASRDRYQKRDELGAIFQLCVAPTAQRKLVGAMLVKSVFERSAYGTRLFCCWCAQDIAANQFWESLGFVPLAFRTGSRKRGPKRDVETQGSRAAGGARVHIFWQRRIREGDTTTPWWFPSLTGGGSIREDRLVLPIPPGVRWDDVMPVVLPGEQTHNLQITNHKEAPRSKVKASKEQAPGKLRIGLGFLKFVGEDKCRKQKAAKAKREKRVKQKNDPKHVAAARELRDRWLEEVNSGRFLAANGGKYDVGRALSDGASTTTTMPTSKPALIPPPLILLDVADAA